MLTFAVSQGSGFVGGPIFPALFVGGTAGVIVHHVLPGVPLGLAFACLLAAVPGALATAPFAMVLMAAFLTQLGALETAPVLIAVITAFLAMEGVKYVLTGRRRAEPAAAIPAARDVRHTEDEGTGGNHGVSGTTGRATRGPARGAPGGALPDAPEAGLHR